MTEKELEKWAEVRADDAGRLARELIQCRLERAALRTALAEIARSDTSVAYIARDALKDEG